MAKDVQNQQLAEWLQLMGCPVELSPEDLQSLNTANMRSVWRHLQRHVKPVRTVRTLKKNLLLAKLRTHSLLPGKFGNFRIESVHQLDQLQRQSVTQEQIDLLKREVKEIDESLLSATSFLTTKITEKKLIMHNLEELQQKEALLNLKLASIQNDIEKLDKELEIAQFLKTRLATQISYSEYKENSLFVAKFVQKFSSVDITEDCIVEMIVSSSEFLPSVIVDGILSVSDHAVKALSSSKISDVLSNLPSKLNSLSFSKHLTDLQTTLYRNELDIHNSSRKVVAGKSELDKERAALCNILEKSPTPGNSDDLTFVELTDKLIENTLIIKRDETLKELLDELQDICHSDFDHANWTVKSNMEKEERLLTDVNEKLSDINTLIEQISTSQVNVVKIGVLQRATDLVSKFLTQLKDEKDDENQCQVFVSENLISKEIEMFHKLPLIAMTRQWEDRFETIPRTVREDILKSPELFNILCQSESKNLVKNIVEKMFWLHTNHHQ